MFLVEPCCAKKHWMALRDAIGKNGTTLFEGYGDISLTELLPALLTRYSEAKMFIASPTIPDQAAEIIKKWMKKQWARMDGTGKLNVVEHLTILSDLDAKHSPAASEWMNENPFDNRMTLCDIRQGETVILMPDLAIIGPVNMQYGNHFVATVTTKQSLVDELWGRYIQLAKPAKKAEPAVKVQEEAPALKTSSSN